MGGIDSMPVSLICTASASELVGSQWYPMVDTTTQSLDVPPLLELVASIGSLVCFHAVTGWNVSSFNPFFLFRLLSAPCLAQDASVFFLFLLCVYILRLLSFLSQGGTAFLKSLQ